MDILEFGEVKITKTSRGRIFFDCSGFTFDQINGGNIEDAKLEVLYRVKDAAEDLIESLSRSDGTTCELATHNNTL